MSKSHIITVSTLPEGEESTVCIYQQIVENLDLASVIEAVNLRDPKIDILPAPRKRRTRSDKGQQRKWDPPKYQPEEAQQE